MERARLTRYGLLSATGADAREFLHAQLTNDVLHLAPDRAVLAGWCSAKGRLLATLLVIPAPQGFLLQLARDLAPAVTKRLSMFILRSKVKIEDVSEAWEQHGVLDAAWQAAEVAWEGSSVKVRVAENRHLHLGPAAEMKAFEANAPEDAWTLEEIRAGRALVTAATQDQFVPQMLNLEKIGAVDFHKGCYPGQEIVARAQYRGEVKRRLVQRRAPAGVQLRPGEAFEGGVVVDSAGGELLAVLPV